MAAKTRNRSLPQQLTLDHVSPATRLLEKRRHMFEVQEALDAQKEEFQRREATFKRREEMLKKKDLELQESLIKFNKFLQENDSKRNRAEKKQLDEKKQKQLKETEIIRLHGEVEKQKAKRAQMMEEVKKMSQYQGYLDGVLEVEEEYPEIADLLARHETLSAAKDDLVRRQEKAAEQNERERKELQEFMQVQTDKILNYNNQIADLQQESEKAAELVLEIQYDADRQVQTVAERTLQLGQVMMACENIYQRCMTKTHVARKEVKDGSGDLQDAEAVVEKLGFIRDYVTDLQAIAKSAKPIVSTPKDGATAAGQSTTGPADAAAAAAAEPGGGSAKRSAAASMAAGGESRGPARSRASGDASSKAAGTSRHSMSGSAEDATR